MDLQTWLATVVGTAAALAPVVAFLVWLVKATPLSGRYYPHASVACGIVLAYAVAWMTDGLVPIKEASLIGALAGGIAAGGFVLGKSAETRVVTETTTLTSPDAAPATAIKVTETSTAEPAAGGQ